MSGLIPSRQTVVDQKRASDPRRSAFVTANAGSGKTYVLVERVVRLLLAGAPPDRILCLTFTRAAAAQMQTKVAERLGRWATLDDEALSRAIEEMEHGEGRLPLLFAGESDRLAEARRLFARALETPGGLKIQTIHAFCERLVQQFPFEANVAAGFDVLDERESAALWDAAKRAVIADIGREPQGELGRALATLVAEGCDGGFLGALDAAFAERMAFQAMFREPATGTHAKAVRALAATLGIDPATTRATVEQDLLEGGLLAGDCAELLAVLETSTVTDRETAATLRQALAARATPDRCRELYLSVFLTGKGERRKSLCAKALAKTAPHLAAALDGEADRVLELLERSRAASALQRTAALMRLADAALQTYATAKARRGALDFDDLIGKTLALLTRTDAAWVLFKLDGGIDHLLIDEAQDTSPDAWRIVQRLAEEFTAGAGAREGATRTVFAVGDEKQSIYSFQGAEPETFGAMRRRFDREHRGAGLKFEKVELRQSFRSAPAVLRAVDHVFARHQAHAGLEAFESRPTRHESARPGAPGIVEIWPLERPDPSEAEEKPAWDAPFDQQRSSSPVVKLANRIAEAVETWISKDRIPAGEILILVRQRRALFEALLRSLKARALPVAGADRLVINDHIAVMDLIALGRALTTPDDDLALAAALKSPLFELDEDDLLAIAPRRSGRLRDALIERAVTARQCEAVRRLLQWEEEAGKVSPFDFYAAVLGRDRRRRAFRERFGTEADDALGAFLTAAENFCARHPPTLAGFLAWMTASATELKRDLDHGGGEVRVMTVHGAKGLEASVVVVAECCTPPRGQDSVLIPVRRARAPETAAPLLVWSPGSRHDCRAVAEARSTVHGKAENEHRRLLYVALTRAKDRLVVAGHVGRNKPPDGCWYNLVREGLEAHCEPVQMDGAGEGAEPLLRLSEGAFAITDRGSGGSDGPALLPDWATTPATRERIAEPLSPSTLVAGTPKRRSGPRLGAADRELGRRRGVLLHRLLETLPQVAPERRAEIAAVIAGRHAGLPDAIRDEAAAAALAILGDARFADVFAPGARTEVPVMGRLPGAEGEPGRLVAGRIDRLLVRAGEVVLVDYKTDAEPPAGPADTPEPYIAQLAAYRFLLGRLYPGRRIRCSLLWTAAPRLEELPAAQLDAAEGRILGLVAEEA